MWLWFTPITPKRTVFSAAGRVLNARPPLHSAYFLARATAHSRVGRTAARHNGAVAAFSQADRDLLQRTDEVGIETRAGRQLPIWVVVVGDDVYIRSVRGIEGRWYQALLGGTDARLHAGDRAWSIKSEQVSDAA